MCLAVSRAASPVFMLGRLLRCAHTRPRRSRRPPVATQASMPLFRLTPPRHDHDPGSCQPPSTESTCDAGDRCHRGARWPRSLVLGTRDGWHQIPEVVVTWSDVSLASDSRSRWSTMVSATVYDGRRRVSLRGAAWSLHRCTDREGSLWWGLSRVAATSRGPGGDVPMRAIIVDPSAPAALRLADVPEPVAGPSQVLLEVHHASLNHGDLNDARSGRVAPGGVLGSDAAGVVAHAAADGRGPAAGTRVVTLAPGAFAERSAVEVGALAEVPPSVDLAEGPASPRCGRCVPPARSWASGC